MKRILLLYFYLMLAESAVDLKSKSVNIALDTVFEFNNNKNSAEIGIIDRVQKFLNRVKTALRSNRRHNDNEKQVKTSQFQNHVEQALKTVLNFTDDDLKDVVGVVKKEIIKRTRTNTNRRYRKSYDVSNSELPSASDIRYKLNLVLKLLRKHSRNPKNKTFAELIRAFDTDDTNEVLKKLVDNLQVYSNGYKRGSYDLRSLIKDTITDYFLTYSFNLDSNLKQVMRSMVQKFLNGNDNNMEETPTKSITDSPFIPKTTIKHTTEEVTTSIRPSHHIGRDRKRKKKVKVKTTTAPTLMQTLWVEKINVQLLSDRSKIKKKKHAKFNLNTATAPKRFTIESTKKSDHYRPADPVISSSKKRQRKKHKKRPRHVKIIRRRLSIPTDASYNYTDVNNKESTASNDYGIPIMVKRKSSYNDNNKPIQQNVADNASIENVSKSIKIVINTSNDKPMFRNNMEHALTEDVTENDSEILPKIAKILFSNDNVTTTEANVNIVTTIQEPIKDPLINNSNNVNVTNIDKNKVHSNTTVTTAVSNATLAPENVKINNTDGIDKKHITVTTTNETATAAARMDETSAPLQETNVTSAISTAITNDVTTITIASDNINIQNATKDVSANEIQKN